MLIYNITLKIEWTIQPEWLQWMREVYITALMNTGCFTQYQLVRLLEIDEEEGPTYALQLYVADRKAYDDFIQAYLPEVEQISYEKWRGNMMSFSTLMESV